MDKEQALPRPVSDAARRELSAWVEVAIFLSFLALCWLAYGGNAAHVLLNFDDIPYITASEWVTRPSWHGVFQAFTRSEMNNWHPLTWLSYMLDYRLCGTDAACFKATNVSLHAANSYLVYHLSGVLLAIAGGAAYRGRESATIACVVAGALFAVHPQHAESVIWVAERKDVLCGAFYLLALLAYLDNRVRGARYSSLPYVFFVLALMSKSMAVTLPAVLVLLDYYPLNRFANVSHKAAFRIIVLEKWHFHLTAILLVGVTLLTQEVGTYAQPTLYERAVISAAAIWHYLSHFVWPVGLSPYYPKELLLRPLGTYPLFLFGGLLVGFAIAAVAGGRPARALLAYFLVTVAPVVGLVKVGEQAFADRYTYLPMVGFYVAAGCLVAAIASGSRARRAACLAFAGGLVLVLANHTRDYKDTWRNNLVLWQFVAVRYPGVSPMVYNNLGNSHFEKRQFREAIDAYERGIAIDPRRPEHYWNLGLAHERLGDRQRALAVYVRGLEANGDIWSYVNLAEAHERWGQATDAARYYAGALGLDRQNSESLLGLGRILLAQGQVQQSIEVLQAVAPDSTSHFQAALLLARIHASADSRRALRILVELEHRYGTSKEIDAVRRTIDK